MPTNAPQLDKLMNIVRNAARQLVGADGVTFIVREGDYCAYLEEDAVGRLWKGQRFPLGACVSGWVMMHGTPAVIPDIYADERVPIEAYRPTFVRSMAMVPVGSPPVAAIGAYWSTNHEATPSQIETLAAIADSAYIQTDR